MAKEKPKEKDWYAPREIRFTRPTTRWLIRNLGCLQSGYWPPEASNYIDMPGTGSKSAYFETPIQYAVEIEQRMEKCGEDGLILLAIYCWEMTLDSLARYFRKPSWVIRDKSKNALDYVASGYNRRWHNTAKRKAVDYGVIEQSPK